MNNKPRISFWLFLFGVLGWAVALACLPCVIRDAVRQQRPFSPLDRGVMLEFFATSWILSFASSIGCILICRFILNVLVDSLGMAFPLLEKVGLCPKRDVGELSGKSQASNNPRC